MRELFSPRNIAVDTLDTLDTPLVNIIVAPCGEAKTPGRGSAKEVPLSTKSLPQHPGPPVLFCIAKR
ncbi:hypothetical protein E5D57_000574 [Metarhizium anisopliae]|nr:hypothetical protein E5D57_000574 [Metarhizium anisopliae]